MKYPGIFSVLVIIGCILFAGCTQPSGTAPVTPLVTPTVPLPSPSPSAVTVSPTTVPQPVVTVVRYVSQVKEIKDSELLFALQVPVEWNVSTTQLVRSDYPEYRTDLGAGTGFFLYSYSITGTRDQAFLGEFRQWSPEPQKTTVTINTITYDRFESAADGVTRVAYVVRRTSANERTYANVLVFAARDSNRFEKEDFEKVVASFRSFRAKSAGTEPGEEIPLYDLAGNPIARTVRPQLSGSLLWEEAGSYSSDGDSSGGDSSGDSSGDGDSGGGGGCGCC